jgi:K+-transporting ATPase ATPase C chain
MAQIRAVMVVFLMLTLLTGIIYPLAVTMVGQAVFPHEANGSMIERDGKPIGSKLIGQPFSDMRYFWGRPSTTSKFPYDSSSSNASNLGPTNTDLQKAVAERVEALRQAHPDQTGPVPVDLVTTSASGLDPHISPAGAEYQVSRVAKARGMAVEDVRRFVAEHTEGRLLGLLGEPRVNVLRLNLALDERNRTSN